MTNPAPTILQYPLIRQELDKLRKELKSFAKLTKIFDTIDQACSEAEGGHMEYRSMLWQRTDELEKRNAAYDVLAYDKRCAVKDLTDLQERYNVLADSIKALNGVVQLTSPK